MYLVRQLIHMKIALKLEHNGKEVTKSILQDKNCPEGTGKGYSNPGVAYVLSFFVLSCLPQIGQVWQACLHKRSIFGHHTH